MSAAVELTDAGHSVVVLESNSYIGGRTASWNENGMEVETGLHRFLGFYTALPELIQKVGVSLDDILCWEDEVEVRTTDNQDTTLGLAPLHKPAKTAWSLLGHNDFLPPSDKMALGKMFARALKQYHSDPTGLDSQTVLEVAKQNGVSDKAVRNILTPLTEGIFFVPVEDYSMHNLVGLFAPYATSMYKLRVGAFMGGMSEVMMKPMADYIAKSRGEVHLNSTVEKLLYKDGSVRGAVCNGHKVQVDHVILAASLVGAKEIIRKTFKDTRLFSKLLKLPTMPAVTFQIELSRPSMGIDRTTFGPETIFASFAEQSRTTFRNSAGRISIILAEPGKHINMPADEILSIIKQDAKRLRIDLSDNVLDYRKIPLPEDFYSLATGSEAKRPGQETVIPGLTLAGDYTKQQHLATMEGAVVSGRLAADIVKKKLAG